MRLTIPCLKRKPSTIARRLSAINAFHKDASLALTASMENPLISRVLQGIRRAKGMAPAAKKPLVVADLEKILPTLHPPIIAARDRALLVVGFTSGMRRSELAALEVAAHLTGELLNHQPEEDISNEL